MNYEEKDTAMAEGQDSSLRIIKGKTREARDRIGGLLIKADKILDSILGPEPVPTESEKADKPRGLLAEIKRLSGDNIVNLIALDKKIETIQKEVG